MHIIFSIIGNLLSSLFNHPFSAAWTVNHYTCHSIVKAYNLLLFYQTFGTFYIQSSWAWRIPSAVQAFPSLLQVLLIWFLPESPRWLIGKGREEEARKVLGYWHGNGDPYVSDFS